MYLNNLTTNKVYDLRIQAGTRSTVGEKIMHFGLFSETRRILLQPGTKSYCQVSTLQRDFKHQSFAGCEAMRTFAPMATEQDSVILINLEQHFGTIAGIVCGTLGLLLAIFVFLILRYVTSSGFTVKKVGKSLLPRRRSRSRRVMA